MDTGPTGRRAARLFKAPATVARVAALGGVCLVAVAPGAAHAVDGIWTGVGAEWTTGANWSSAPAVPDNTATFTNNGAPTSIAISNTASIDTIRFDAAAPAYTFTVGAGIQFQIITGGIVNGSAFAPTFIHGQGGFTTFYNASNAGNAVFINNQDGTTVFRNSSSAGNATVVNDGVFAAPASFAGGLDFIDSSTAANATIANRNYGFTQFFGFSSGGNATITNSTNGPVDPTASGGTYFVEGSSAGSATIVNDGGGITYFMQASTAGNATITNNAGGGTYFYGSSTGGQARLVANAGGTVDISALTSGGMTAGSIEGAGNYFLGAQQLTVGGNNLSTVVSGVIADGGQAGGAAGSLVKVGTGTLVLSGANTYTGPTTISAGTLAVTGSITSNVTIDLPGTLAGTGTIAGDVTNNGTLSPGNGSIGTLNVAGNYAQAVGSSYAVQVNNLGQADKVAITGTAAVQGGTVAVAPGPGSYAPRTTYTIVNATGGVVGAYSAVTSSAPFLVPSLSYDANDVYLNLQIGGFARAAQTPTQAAVGAVLDAAAPTATGDFATVLGALAPLDLSQGLGVLTAISGQNYSGFSDSMLQGARLFMNSFPFPTGGPGAGNRVALAEACDVACDAVAPGRWGAWGGALGGTGTVAAGASPGALTYSAGGFAAGLDRKLTPNLLAGVALGYTTGAQWVSGFDGRGTTDTFLASLYGSFREGPIHVDGIAGYAFSRNRMARNIAIPGLQPRSARGETGANQFYGQLETGYRFDIGGVADTSVTPFVRLQAITATQDAFSESGAQSLDLNIATQTTNSLRSVIGAQFGTALDPGWREKIALQLRLGWSHEYADTARPVSATLAGAPTLPFTTYGGAQQRDGVVLAFGADTAIAPATSIYLRYEGNLYGRDSSHALTAGLRITW